MLLGDFMVRGANWFPEKTATVFEDTRLTYRQLNQRTNSLAHALLDLGVKADDRVTVVCHNCHQYLECIFAMAKIGAVTANMNWRLSPKEMAFLINDSDAQIVLFSKRFEMMLEPLQESLDREHIFISIDGEIEGMKEYEALITGYPDHEPKVEIDEDDTVQQIYTSGTTGRPKGVMLTHRNVITNAFNFMIETPNKHPNTTALNILPMFHVAVYAPINVMFSGGTNVFMAAFDFDPVLSTIEKEKVNQLALTPAVIQFLVDYPKLDDYDLSSLEDIGYAAAPMSPYLLKRGMEKFKCRFVQAFGMTEMSPALTILLPEQHVPNGPEYMIKRLESVGRPMVNVEVKLVDEKNNECAVGVIGEVIARGKTMMKGYHKLPEATAEVIRNGWYHTGDMGYFDEYGYLFLVDRKKDMIISGGENIYPKEIENCIIQMDRVAEVAVIGIPHEKWGETPLGFVIPVAGAELSETEVIDYCKENLASYKKPSHIEFVTEFPTNAMGKVQKQTLRAPYWADSKTNIN